MAVHYKGPDQRYAYTNVKVETENGISTVTKYIGMVLDREKKIYSKSGEVFYYDDENDSTQKVTEEFTAIEYVDHRSKSDPDDVDFGSTFALYNFLGMHQLFPVLESVDCPNIETFISLVFFYLLSDWPNYLGHQWYGGDVLQFFYPKAAMSDSSLSDLLAYLGDSRIKFDFLEVWAEYVQAHFDERGSVLVDSTGLPNKIKSRYAAWWNHNGEAEYGARLILVCLKGSGIPIYYELIEGNIVDKSVLQVTILRVEQIGYQVEECIFDNGFVTGDNINLFYNVQHELTIDYLTRIRSDDKDYSSLLLEEAVKIRDNPECYVNYDDRAYFIKGFPVLAGANKDNPAWLYLCLDEEARADKLQKLSKNEGKVNKTREQIFEERRTAGWFGILSGSRRAIKDVLPDYYDRIEIERGFDLSKHFAKLLPLRKHNDNTLQGHVFVSFVATCIQKMLQRAFKEARMSLGERLKAMCVQKANVHHTLITINPAKKEVADIYRKVLGIACPASLPLHDGQITYTPPGQPIKRRRKKTKKEKKEAKSKRGPGRPPGAKNKKTLEREAREALEKKQGKGNSAESAKKAAKEKKVSKNGKRLGRPPGAKNKTSEQREAEKAAKVPKKRGRPPGAKNKKTIEREKREKALQEARENPQAKRGRGRPPGARNKTQEEKALEAAKKKPRGRPKKVKEEPEEKKEFHLEVERKKINFRKITVKKKEKRVTRK